MSFTNSFSSSSQSAYFLFWFSSRVYFYSNGIFELFTSSCNSCDSPSSGVVFFAYFHDSLFDATKTLFGMENRLLRCRRSCLVLVEMQKPPPTIHPGVFFPSPPNISSSEGLSNVLLSLFKCAILVFHLKFFAPATCYYTESK